MLSFKRKQFHSFHKDAFRQNRKSLSIEMGTVDIDTRNYMCTMEMFPMIIERGLGTVALVFAF